MYQQRKRRNLRANISRKLLFSTDKKYKQISQLLAMMTFYHQQVKKINDDFYPNSHLTSQVIRAKHYMDNNFEKNITLDDISREAFISKFHFLRLFKKLYGRTPHQHLTSVRIEKAKQLLKKNHSVSDICFSIGFDSITSFSGLFKKITGYSPIAFHKPTKQKSNFRETIV
jgi:AraC-like DNA-binding protein